MKKLAKAILTSLGLLPFITSAESKTDPSNDIFSPATQTSSLRKARFNIEAQTGSRTIGTIDAMIPFIGDDDFIVYADLIGKFGTGENNSNGNTLEGNAGLGFRRVNDSETAIYGMYAFYDYYRSVNNNIFHQTTVGAERLGLTWDFRANAYLPLGTKSYTNNIYAGGTVVIDEHDLIAYIHTNTESLSAGGDLEVGRTLGTNKLRGYLAAYSFGPGLTGPRARAEYKINERFTLTGAVQYDQDRGTQYFVGARFTIGGAQARDPNSIYSRLTDPVVRDVDVVTKNTIADATIIDYDRFFMVDTAKGSGGDGTVVNPFGNVSEAIAAAPDGAIIFVVGESTATVTTGSLTLKDGQILWGGEKALYWDFANNQPLFAPDASALLVRAGQGVHQTLATNITMANNSGIYNFNLVASSIEPNNSGVYIDNVQNVTLNEVNISGFQSGDDSNSSNAIYVTGANSTVTATNITLDNNDVGVLLNNGSISFSDLTINNSTAYGIKSTGGLMNAANVVISQTGIDGIHNENTAFFANNVSVATSAGYGIYQSGGQLNVTQNITVTASGSDGIHNESAANLFAGSISVANSGGYNIYQSGGQLGVSGAIASTVSGKDGIHAIDATLTAGSVSVANSTGYGIYQTGGQFTVGENITVATSTSDGIHSENANLAAGSIDVTGSGGYGIYQSGGDLTINQNVTVTGSSSDGMNMHDVNVFIGGDGNLNNNQGNGLSATGGTLNIYSLTANTNTLNGISLTNVIANFTNATTNENSLNGFYSYDSELNVAGAVTANNNVQDGLHLETNYGDVPTSTTVYINSLTSQNNGGYGLTNLYIGTQINQVTIQNNADTGIFNNGGVLTVLGGDVSNNTSDGIHSAYGEIYLSNLVVNQNGGNGVWLESAQGYLSLDNSQITNNTENGLLITTDATADISNINFTGNGLTNLASVTELSDLYSAIQVGDSLNNATLNATNITVTGNASGIELAAGTVNLTTTGTFNNLINNNYGYGVWIQEGNGSSSSVSRNITIVNTTIQNTQAVTGIPLSGYGIYGEYIDSMNLENVTVNNNASTGLWIQTGTVTGTNVTLNANGAASATPGVDNSTYGMRVDQTDDNNPTSVTLTNVTATYNPSNGLVVTGGNTHITNLKATNNADGVLLVNGTLLLDGTFNLNNNNANGLELIAGSANLNGSGNISQNNLSGIYFNPTTTTGLVFSADGLTSGLNLSNNKGYGIYMGKGLTQFNLTNVNIISINNSAGLWMDSSYTSQNKLPNSKIKNTGVIRGSGTPASQWPGYNSYIDGGNNEIN